MVSCQQRDILSRLPRPRTSSALCIHTIIGYHDAPGWVHISRATASAQPFF